MVRAHGELGATVAEIGGKWHVARALDLPGAGVKCQDAAVFFHVRLILPHSQ